MKTLAARPGYFPLLAFLALLSVSLALPSCNVIPKTQVVAEVDTVFEDGTEAMKGEFVYVGPDGKDTANATDPSSGAENPPAMKNDLKQFDKAGAAVEKGTSWIPPPFGWILGAVVVGGLAGVRRYLAKQNEDRTKRGGGKPKT